MPPKETPAAIARRDDLLDQLEGYHDKLLRAARDGDDDVLNSLVEKRHDVIERLKRAVEKAPITRELVARLATREQELQRLLKLELSGIQTDLGQKSRLSSAAIRYQRSR